MGKLDPEKILRRVEKEKLTLVPSRRGVSHPFFDLLQKMRQSFLSLSYLDAVASLTAARVEEVAESSGEKVDVWVKIAKLPSDVNLGISEVARRYITGKKRKIDVAESVFIGVRAEIAEA